MSAFFFMLGFVFILFGAWTIKNIHCGDGGIFAISMIGIGALLMFATTYGWMVFK
jgi:hypothetical protein